MGRTFEVVDIDLVPVKEFESRTIIVRSFETLKYIDMNLRHKVKRIQIRDGRNFISQNEINQITKVLAQDFQHLEHLYIERAELSSVEFLKNIPNLTILRVTDTDLVDLTPISCLKKLEVLEVYNNKIKDIDPLRGLLKLHWLDIAGNQVQSLKPISGLNLKELKAGDNQFTDLTPLARMVSLEWLSLYQTREGSSKILSIQPLAGLTNLTHLFIKNNNIKNIWPLQNLTQLEVLVLSENGIVDIRGLGKLYSHKTLHLDSNQIWDIKIISNLQRLTYLNLKDNKKISNVTSLSKLQPGAKILVGDKEIYQSKKRKYEEVVTGPQNGYSCKLEDWSDESDGYFDDDEEIYEAPPSKHRKYF